MSVRRLFNHRVTPHRATYTRDDFGGTTPTWAAQSAPARLNARPDQDWSGAQQDHGPGEQQGAKRRWFLDRGIDIAERDVLEVVDGPEAPSLLRVESVTKPTQRGTRVHHIEVNVEVWEGSLEEPPA